MMIMSPSFSRACDVFFRLFRGKIVWYFLLQDVNVYTLYPKIIKFLLVYIKKESHGGLSHSPCNIVYKKACADFQQADTGEVIYTTFLCVSVCCIIITFVWNWNTLSSLLPFVEHHSAVEAVSVLVVSVGSMRYIPSPAVLPAAGSTVLAAGTAEFVAGSSVVVAGSTGVAVSVVSTISLASAVGYNKVATNLKFQHRRQSPIHILTQRDHPSVKITRYLRSENRIFPSFRKIVRKNRIFQQSAQYIVFQ